MTQIIIMSLNVVISSLHAGGELIAYIYKKQRLDENETRKFIRQIVSAVDHLHKAGIIHRYMYVINFGDPRSPFLVPYCE